MAVSRILGPDGQPIEYEKLTEELAAPRVSGVRSIWQSSVANALTPERLASVLQAANDGSAHDYLTLAEEMEERDLHYASVLGTRKQAVTGLDVRVEAFSDAKRDVMIADAVREFVAAPEFEEMLAHQVDALGKGYAVSELMWDRSGRTWTPHAYHERDPRFFQFDRITGRELRLLDDESPVEGLALPHYKFIVHRPRLRSGLPIRGGLARLAAVAYMCKAWTWKDWMGFADIYGIPMRVGRYGTNTSEENIAKLMAAVANLGSDAAAVIPDSMKIEFQKAVEGNGAGDFFLKLAEWWDKQVSKGVLGQTMTTDDGSSRAQADVHQQVRGDIQTADAKALSNTVQRMVVMPFVDLNYGPGQYPKFSLYVPKPEDIKTLVDALAQLVPLGLEVEQSVIRDKLGLPDPDKGAVLLRQMPEAQAQNQQRALNAESTTDTPPPAIRTSQRLANQLDEQQGAITDAWLERVRNVIDSAKDWDAVRDGLMALQSDIDLDEFGMVMAEALTAARMAGRYDLLKESGLE